MRVLHLSVVRLSSGQRKQLEYEQRAAGELNGVEWHTLVLSDQSHDAYFVKQLPVGFRGVFSRKLYAWLWLLRHAHDYEVVLVRHMPFDPFALLFARWVRNRVTVHHSKEVEELRLVGRGWQGRAASWLEGITGHSAVRSGRGVLGVTDEIRRYQLANRGVAPEFPSGIYPNGIWVDDVNIVADERPSDRIEIAFLCGRFSTWHGLDLLLEEFEREVVAKAVSKPITLHLIGQLPDQQKAQVRRLSEKLVNHRLALYGLMSAQEYRPIFARCHVGIGSLAMHRSGLEEGATLKVREMLAMGISVYSGHRDAAIPEEFPFYHRGTVDLGEIIVFAEAVSGVARSEVQTEARQYIDKRACMQGVVGMLSESRLV